MKFGVGVEGPSDLAFWDKVLHKNFPGCRFDIRNMKNRVKLIRETPILYESFKDLHAGFNTLGFAKEIAPKFQPKRALPHSTSFKLFWERVEFKCRPQFA